MAIFYLQISTLINAVTSLLACAIVVFRNPKSAINRTFGYFSLSVALWAGGYCIWQFQTDYENSLLWCRILMMMVIPVIPAFLLFVTTLTRKVTQYRNAIFLLCLAGILLQISNLSSLLIKGMSPLYSIPFWPEAGFGFYIFTFLMTLMVVIAHCLLFQTVKISHGQERKQLEYVFFGTALGFLGAFTSIIPWFGVPLVPFGNILVSCYVFSIGYAVVKYHLMDIRIVFRRSMVYSILIACVTTLYFILVFVLESIFRNIIGYQSFPVSLATATIIAILFSPLKMFIQSGVDRYFFKASHSHVVEHYPEYRQQAGQIHKYKTLAIVARDMAEKVKKSMAILKMRGHELAEDPGRPDARKVFLEALEFEAGTITGMINHLTAYLEPAPLIKENCDIGEILNHACAEIEAGQIYRPVPILKNFNENRSYDLFIDKKQMHIAIKNILLNAMESISAEGGMIIIDVVRRRDNVVQIDISDVGVGIPSNALEKIFQPFFSLKKGKTGLGLSIASDIIKSHGGKISVESGVGMGTEVSIELPIENPPLGHSPQP